MTAPANWYPDPTVPGGLRYWDGRQWTDHVAQPEGGAPAAYGAWPAMQPGGPALAPVREYRRVRVPGLLALAGMGLVALMQVLGAAVAPSSLRRLGTEILVGGDPYATFTLLDVVNFVRLLVMAGTVAACCVWLWGVRRNAEALRPGAVHARSRNWTWAGWLVPVVSLWFPYQCVRDVLRATGRPGWGGVGWWWTAFLVMSFATVLPELVAEPFGSASEVADRGSAVAILYVVTAVLTAVQALVLARVMRRIDQDQTAAAKADAPL
ncbi:DUF4328 domain-containing protein [Nocardioides sp.]|uniref:DUF4328 domain-containing protein n=1 Tax=Nocardioides sp. TaxID=35761 RepID=UPI00261B5494|nr:DUF4328 domain-containing protein [Nocardioides sp.]